MRSIPVAGRVALGTALGLALILTITPTAAHAQQASWFWEWSDGSRDRQRTVSEARFDTWDSIPAVTVASSPARPGVRVELQVHDGTAWRTEDVALTDARGRASLRVNPYCDNGDWCQGRSRYRLRAGAATASLSVAFTPRPGPP